MNNKVVENYLVCMIVKFQPHCFYGLRDMIFLTDFRLKFRLERQMEF
jgi:hypothetical protein